MIRLIDAVVRYPGTAIPALAGITMDIPVNSVVAVMGANGSGKSTLARLVAGLQYPSVGSVTIDGVAAGDGDAFLEVRKRIGIVFQDPRRQITSLTVEREIAFGLQNLRHSEEIIHDHVEKTLVSSGLADRRAAHPMNLSGGEQQRLALAAVLAMEPGILILDEVTSLLSPASREKIMDQVAALRRSRGLTVLLMTQFPGEALAAERLVVLDGGRIALDGVPADVFSHRDELSRCGVDLPPWRT